jgi:hypothetical protein
MVKTKWRLQKDGRPFENRTFVFGFRMVASLDRFIKKRAIKNILFMPKWSRLELKKTSVRFSNVKNKMAAI